MGEGCFWGESEIIGGKGGVGRVVEIIGCIMHVFGYDEMCIKIDL